MPSKKSPAIGYVLKKYPRLSETFILNELLGLEALGTPVSVFSLHLPDEGRFHADVSRLQGDVVYLPGFRGDTAYEAFEIVKDLPEGALGEALGFLELIPHAKKSQLLVQSIHLAREVRRRGIEHLHAHFMTVASWAACVAHILTGVRFSVTSHAKDIYRETVDPALYREVARRASRIVTVCDSNRDHIVRTFLGGNSDGIERIYNGLPLDELVRSSESSREREPALVLGVGRLVEKKGFDVLLQACALLGARGVRYRCLLLGDGEERQRLTEQVRRLGLEETVELRGACPREEVLATMSRARVLAAPCRVGSDGNRDALPTVLLEAQALGLPAVSTPVTGIPEIIDHGTTGMLVPEDDADALANAIEALITDDGLWQRLSEAGPVRARERFDRKVTLPLLARVFAGAPVLEAVP